MKLEGLSGPKLVLPQGVPESHPPAPCRVCHGAFLVREGAIPGIPQVCWGQRNGPKTPPHPPHPDHHSPPLSLCTFHQGRRPERSETSWGQGKGLITGSIEGGQPDPSLAVLTALGAPLAPKRPGEVSEHSSLEPCCELAQHSTQCVPSPSSSQEKQGQCTEK